MDEREHEDMRSLIAPYVLGAVSPEEMAHVRAHLLSCDECLAAAERLAPAADSLAASVEEVEPPPGFSERVMNQVRADRSTAAAATPSPARRWGRLPAFAAVALLLVTAVMGVALYRSDRALDIRTQAISGLLPGDGIKLQGTGASAAMVPTEDGALLVAQGLGSLPDDRVYQLWLMKGDCEPGSNGECDIRGAGTFTTDQGLTIVEVDESLAGYSRAAVTVEPEGGSEQPTSDPVVDSATA